MLQKPARLLLAAVQAILGWEWLTSGGNKLLSGIFPQGLADTLTGMMKDNPNGWYVSFLQNSILPHSALYGYLIEWTEVVLGVILLGGAVIFLGQPRRKGQPQYRLMLAYSIAAIGAALVGAFMTVNFHFMAGMRILPWFNASAPNGEGIDLDALLPPLSLIIFLGQAALIAELTDIRRNQRVQRLSQRFFSRRFSRVQSGTDSPDPASI